MMMSSDLSIDSIYKHDREARSYDKEKESWQTEPAFENWKQWVDTFSRTSNHAIWNILNITD